jgi:hypothetical protein
LCVLGTRMGTTVGTFLSERGRVRDDVLEVDDLEVELVVVVNKTYPEKRLWVAEIVERWACVRACCWTSVTTYCFSRILHLFLSLC